MPTDDPYQSNDPYQVPDQMPEPLERHSDADQDKLAARPHREPDPGSRSAGLLTLAILVPVLVVVVFLQQRSVILTAAQAEAEAQQIVPSGKADTFGLLSRFTVKFHHTMMDLDPNQGATALESAGYMENLDDAALSPHEMMRAAVVAAELSGPEVARERLDNTYSYTLGVMDQLDEEYAEAVFDDIEAFQDIYAGNELPPEVRDRIVEHHGWHGRLALTYGKDNDDPERAELIAGGMGLMFGLVGFGALVVIVLLGGFVLLVVGIVLLAAGKFRLRFAPPGVGGSVYLETFAVFVAAFLFTQLMSMLLMGKVPEAVILGIQWLVALSIFWPMVRGVSFARWKSDMGFEAPEGVMKEIGLGIVTYLACVPLYFAAALLSFLLLILRALLMGSMSGDAAPVVEAPVSNPIIDMIERTDAVTLIVLGSLMCVWAPLVEEAIMRGALFRHFRSRFMFIFSALFSAALFGVLHQYDVLMLVPIITLGAAFAFLREWRGNIVGCMTAHAMHNCTIFVLILWLVSAI
ncbi:MAG: CPBP family intramembrane metalloprotease [Phycisphaera sp.]|nr:MAG: CPBP family intramembrane metalloprotease [Phycisphaera sp.]